MENKLEWALAALKSTIFIALAILLGFLVHDLVFTIRRIRKINRYMKDIEDKVKEEGFEKTATQTLEQHSKMTKEELTNEKNKKS